MNWGPDPSLDWPSRFHRGDVVRVDESFLGEPGPAAVVAMVLNYGTDSSSPKYDLVLTHRLRNGALDDAIFVPWHATPAPDAKSREEARAQGLLEGFDEPDEN